MMEGDTEVGRKRRLPLWMLGVSDAGEVRNSEKQDEGCFPLQGKSQPEGYRVKAKPTTSRSRKKVCKGETKTSDGDSGCLLTCETRERTRKASRQNVDPSTSFTSIREAEVQKKARKIDSRSKPTKVMKKTASTERKSKVSKNREESEAVSSMEGNEDEVELTMEDLMNIAQEYVAADSEKQHQQAVKGDSKLDPFANTLGNVNADKENQQQQEVTIDLKVKAFSSSKSTSVPSRRNVGLSLESAGNNTGLSKCTQAPSHLTGAGRKEKESQSLESAPIHIPRTGDAAQDMLDLFLGPLLKKPRTEERKLETITAEEMTLALQSSKQERNEVLGEGGEVPFIKKKSSLKDKVAMFLD